MDDNTDYCCDYSARYDAFEGAHMHIVCDLTSLHALIALVCCSRQ